MNKRKTVISFWHLLLGFLIAFVIISIIEQTIKWELFIAIVIGSGMAEMVRRRKQKKEGTPEVDERVKFLMQKYMNIVFIFALIVLNGYLLINQYLGNTTIPINQLFIFNLLVLFALSTTAIIAKR
ncbi:hypothetical protein GCM10023310_52010 [Paenibacillus vulneris]|uniref:Uncharacterized protein n=1 Tax=Paenibacillus vulneris TaxID=1133364 RepID=A0ABW3UJX8_9BACL|nr:hypothetical protein [Paenibacillus sp. 32352]